MSGAEVFWALVAISFCCCYVALRARSWPFALAAFLLIAPISLLSYALAGYLTLWACLLLTLAVGLRWTVSAVGWFGLVLAAAALWFAGLASGPWLHWPRETFWVLPFGVLVGLFSLVMSEPPWKQAA